jgi:hypothetical protein
MHGSQAEVTTVVALVTQTIGRQWPRTMSTTSPSPTCAWVQGAGRPPCSLIPPFFRMWPDKLVRSSVCGQRQFVTDVSPVTRPCMRQAWLNPDTQLRPASIAALGQRHRPSDCGDHNRRRPWHRAAQPPLHVLMCDCISGVANQHSRCAQKHTHSDGASADLHRPRFNRCKNDNLPTGTPGATTWWGWAEESHTMSS